MSRVRLPLLLALITVGCFELRGPPLPEPRDAHVAPDAPPSAPAILGIEPLDARGDTWPELAIPRRVAIRVRASTPIDANAIFLLHGDDDADLREDLEASPLRASTLARAIPHEREVDGRTIVLRPDLLERDDEIVVAVAAWARDERGRTVDGAFVEAMRVAADDAAGARALEAWPPDGASAIGPTMPIAGVRFDGIVSGLEDGLWIEGPDGAPVPASARAARCGEIGWDDGHCAVVVPTRPLAPGAAHARRVGDERDATGAVIPAFRATFTTGEDDHEPPVLRAPACAVDEQLHEGLGCVLADDARVALRVAASEPARLRLRVGARLLTRVATRGEASIAIDDLGPSATISIALEAIDPAGNAASTTAELATTEPLAPISIVAVRADPLGPEPRQEYVEIRNLGAIAVDLEGFAIADSATSEGDRIEGSRLLAPGATALLVSSDLDPDERASGDAPIPPGLMLIRLDRSIGSGGLANGGEPLFLRDAAARRISAAPALPEPREGVCLVRVSADPRTGAIGSFEYDPAGGCSPGRAR